MNSVLRTAEQISRYLVWIGGTLIILSALMVTLEVVLRKALQYQPSGVPMNYRDMRSVSPPRLVLLTHFFSARTSGSMRCTTCFPAG